MNATSSPSKAWQSFAWQKMFERWHKGYRLARWLSGDYTIYEMRVPADHSYRCRFNLCWGGKRIVYCEDYPLWYVRSSDANLVEAKLLGII